jgi:hypothetical protein
MAKPNFPEHAAMTALATLACPAGGTVCAWLYYAGCGLIAIWFVLTVITIIWLLWSLRRP